MVVNYTNAFIASTKINHRHDHFAQKGDSRSMLFMILAIRLLSFLFNKYINYDLNLMCQWDSDDKLFITVSYVIDQDSMYLPLLFNLRHPTKVKKKDSSQSYQSNLITKNLYCTYKSR